MRHSTLLLPLVLTACMTAQSPEPSLAPRSAEAIDPRVPIPAEPVAGPVDPALATQLAALLQQVRQGDAVFQAAADDTAQLVAAAGPAQSESWIEAQQSLSALVAVRAPVTKAISDIDELAAQRLAATGGIPAGDLGAIQAASAEAGAIGQRQAARIEALQARLAA